jgi:hypothetical protein
VALASEKSERLSGLNGPAPGRETVDFPVESTLQNQVATLTCDPAVSLYGDSAFLFHEKNFSR